MEWVNLSTYLRHESPKYWFVDFREDANNPLPIICTSFKFLLFKLYANRWYHEERWKTTLRMVSVATLRLTTTIVGPVNSQLKPHWHWIGWRRWVRPLSSHCKRISEWINLWHLPASFANFSEAKIDQKFESNGDRSCRTARERQIICSEKTFEFSRMEWNTMQNLQRRSISPSGIRRGVFLRQRSMWCELLRFQ